MISALLLLASVAAAFNPLPVTTDSAKNVEQNFMDLSQEIARKSCNTGCTINGNLVISGGSITIPSGGLTYNGYLMPSPSSIALSSSAASTSGSLVKCVSSNTIGRQSLTGTVAIPIDGTIPQNTEGFQLLELSITPAAAGNLLYIRATINNDDTVASKKIATLFKDTGADAISAGTTVGEFTAVHIIHRRSAGAASAQTFKLRVGTESGGNFIVNGFGANSLGNVIESGLEVCEYAQ